MQMALAHVGPASLVTLIITVFACPKRGVVKGRASYANALHKIESVKKEMRSQNVVHVCRDLVIKTIRGFVQSINKWARVRPMDCVNAITI